MENKVKQYHKIMRFENAIVEEKLDGSNFCFMFDEEENKLRFFSRTRELSLEDCDKFFKPFIEYITTKTSNGETLKGLPNIKIFGEAIGQAHIKYGIEGQPAENRLFLFDMKGRTSFFKRKYLEQFCEDQGFNIVPTINLEQQESNIGNHPLREGFIYRFETEDGVFKIKVVERKGGK